MNEEKAECSEKHQFTANGSDHTNQVGGKIKTKVFLKTKLKPNDLKHSTHNSKHYWKFLINV